MHPAAPGQDSHWPSSLRRSRRLDKSAALLQATIADAQMADAPDIATAASAELALMTRKGCMPWWGWLLVIGGPILLVILLVILWRD